MEKVTLIYSYDVSALYVGNQLLSVGVDPDMHDEETVTELGSHFGWEVNILTHSINDIPFEAYDPDAWPTFLPDALRVIGEKAAVPVGPDELGRAIRETYAPDPELQPRGEVADSPDWPDWVSSGEEE